MRSVHAADIQDRDGGILLFGDTVWQISLVEDVVRGPRLQGRQFRPALADILPFIAAEIIKRPYQAKGFADPPTRWIVERTVGWLNRSRRLANDWENLNRKGLAFLRLAPLRLMLRKLCNPRHCTGRFVRWRLDPRA
jgi:transposase